MQLANVLSQMEFRELYNVEGGMMAYASEVDSAAVRK
jgi:rhodanese-related sulfurtransferase